MVTLVNSAVDNFYQRVSGFVEDRGLLPHLGYRVRTLHGLAHDIVRERPDLVGLSDDFQIVDEREADSIREEVAAAWLRAILMIWMSISIRSWTRAGGIGCAGSTCPTWSMRSSLAFIRYAKDYQLTPERLRQQLDRAARVRCRWRRWVRRSTPITSAPWPTAARSISTT